MTYGDKPILDLVDTTLLWITFPGSSEHSEGCQAWQWLVESVLYTPEVAKAVGSTSCSKMARQTPNPLVPGPCHST